MLVSEILPDVRDILGNCSVDLLYKRITEAVEVLSNKGQWNPNIGYVDICALSDGKTVTLPREIDTPLAVNVGGAPKAFRSRWHEFHLNGAGSFAETGWNWDDVGDVCTVMDIINASNLICVADLKNDLGSAVRVFGYDDSGNWIRTQDADGVWGDGFLVPVNLATDFPNGIIVPDTTRVFIRTFATTQITNFISSGAHQIVSGEPGVLALVNFPLPTPLVVGDQYYMRKIDDTSISLHLTQSQALNGTSPVIVTSASNASIISMTDTRGVRVLTQFTSVAAHNIKTGASITFTAVALPTGIVAGTTYFAHVIDANNFTAHATFDDANSNTNPIDVTDAGNTVVVHASQDFNPITLFTFSVNHDFLQGDIVRVQNSTGTFPEPLLAGVNYFVRYVSATSLTLHTTLADASAGTNPIVLLSSGAGVTTIVKTILASSSSGTSNNITAVGHNLTQTTTSAPIASASRARATNVATIVTGVLHNLTSGDYISVASMGGADYNTLKAQVTVINPTKFTYPDIGANEGTQADVAGRITKIPSTGDFVQFSTGGTFPNPITQNTTYRAEAPMSADTFTLYTTSADPVDITTSGSGQLFLVISRVLTIGFTSRWQTDAEQLSTGDIVKVASTGSLPATSPALSTATNYYIRKIDANTVELYDTLARASDTTTRTVSSRKRLSNVVTIVTVAAHTLTTGDYVDVAGVATALNGVLRTCTIGAGGTLYVDNETVSIVDGTGHTATGKISVTAGAITAILVTDGGAGFTVAGTLTVTGAGSADATVTVATVANSVPNITNNYNGNRKQVTVVNATTFTYASTGLNEPTTTDTGTVVVSDIKVIGVGSGDVTLVFDRSVTATVFSSLMPMSSAEFLQDGATIRFTTTGTLPSPLLVATDYHLSVSGGLLQVMTTLDVNIPLTTIGSGTHAMVLVRNFSIVLPTQEVVTANEYTDGDAVTLQTTGTLPAPLALATTYYIRRIDNNNVEIYDTAAHAINTAATTGRITPTNTGTGVHGMVQVLTNFLVKKITRISKSASSGFIKLYAWDTGRNTSLTILGDYYPDEIEPVYRRIRVGHPCAWIRMRYRRRAFKATSERDFVPLRSKMSIVAMVKALSQLRKEFVDQYEKFSDIAVKLLTEDETCNMGPDSPTIQIDADIFTNPDAQGMDTGRDYYW